LGAVRFELRAGVTRRSRVRVTFPALGDPPYELRERVGFAGGLIEVQSGGTTVAVQGAFARAHTERLGDAPSSEDLWVRETTRTTRLRLRQRVAENSWLEADIQWKDRPEQRARAWRTGREAPFPGSSFAHHDRELLGTFGVARQPVNGWTGRIYYADLDREAGPLVPYLTARNQRVVMEGGYRFASGFDVTAGVRWDVDAWSEKPFDGGQLRFVAVGP
jgi:hypothetical protein